VKEKRKRGNVRGKKTNPKQMTATSSSSCYTDAFAVAESIRCVSWTMRSVSKWLDVPKDVANPDSHVILTPLFEFADCMWRFKLHRELAPGHMSLFLVRVGDDRAGSNHEPVSAKWRAMLQLGGLDEKVEVPTQWKMYRLQTPGWGKVEAVPLEKLQLVRSTNDCLSFQAQVVVKPSKPHPPDTRFTSDLESLCTSGWKSDVVLRLDNGATLPAHRSILGARSPFFRAMFSHDMKEARENDVLLPGASEGACRQLLCFIYTGRVNLQLWAPLAESTVEKVDDLAVELAALADRCQLPSLVDYCHSELRSTLTAENVAMRLHLASRHCVTRLQVCVSCVYVIMNRTMRWIMLKRTINKKARPLSHPQAIGNSMRNNCLR
jgi:hypothetical protein